MLVTTMRVIAGSLLLRAFDNNVTDGRQLAAACF